MAETLGSPSSVYAVDLVDRDTEAYCLSGSLAPILTGVFCSGFLHGLVPRAMWLFFDAVAFRASELYFGPPLRVIQPTTAVNGGR